MINKHLAVTIAALFFVSCVSCPTPSGRPELKVSILPHEVKLRLVNRYSNAGWMVTASDDVGVTVTSPLSDGARLFAGSGMWLMRFNLAPLKPGPGTQIRATCYMQTQNPMDCSQQQAGWDTQQALENEFRDCRIDGPYIKPRN
jgi:hypothetical protein